MTPVQSSYLLLKQLLGSAVLSPSGERLGHLKDVIARLAEPGYPRITGLKVSIGGGRELYVPLDKVASLAPGRVQLTGQTLNLGQFERHQGEVLLDEDVLDRRLIDVAAGRLVHANDLALAPPADGSGWFLAGVDPRSRSIVDHLLSLVRPPSASSTPVILDWSRIQPFVGHVPTAGLLMPLGPFKRLHPAQIADLVEQASHEQGEEIMSAVEGDPELTADIFEELDADHQEEFLEDRSDEETAALLARMAPDDAVDLLNEMDQDRRGPVLGLVPDPQRGKLHALLQYHPATAGGMMSPDFIAVPRLTPVAQVLERLRSDEHTPVPLLGTVFVVEPDGTFVGSASVVDLVRASSQQETEVQDLPALGRSHVLVSADLAEIALLMADFNLTALAVVDPDDHLVGAISVDDLVGKLVPDEWRRRAEVSSGD